MLSSAVPAYRRLNYTPSLDRTRPFDVVTPGTDATGAWEYRYLDTGELVVVPDTWFNRPIGSRVDQLLAKAAGFEAQRTALLAHPRPRAPAWLVRRQEAVYRLRASGLREIAARLQREGEAFFYDVEPARRRLFLGTL